MTDYMEQDAERLIQTLESCAVDPMSNGYAEVSKRLLVAAACSLRTLLAHIQRGAVPVYCTPIEHEGQIVYEHTSEPIPNADGFVLYAPAPDQFRDATKMMAEPAEVPMPEPVGFIKPDTASSVYFYEQDFYVLSNFSAFSLAWKGFIFPTSEHAYQWEKFNTGLAESQTGRRIRTAESAHEASKIAERCKRDRRPEWDEVKVDTMRGILTAKVVQHEYVRRKLLETGDRELIEDSWRDDFWGWGANRDGKNMLGKLWMEIRAALRGEVKP